MTCAPSFGWRPQKNNKKTGGHSAVVCGRKSLNWPTMQQWLLHLSAHHLVKACWIFWLYRFYKAVKIKPIKVKGTRTWKQLSPFFPSVDTLCMSVWGKQTPPQSWKVIEREEDGDRQGRYPRQIAQVTIQGILTRPAVCYSSSWTSLNSQPLSDPARVCQAMPAYRDHSEIRPGTLTRQVHSRSQSKLKKLTTWQLLLCCKRKSNQKHGVLLLFSEFTLHPVTFSRWKVLNQVRY